MNKDMTVGSPRKILWAFSLPLLLSVMFQQMYNIADSVIAGKCVGVDALAAVGASYPVTMLFMAIAIGSNIGSSVVISQYFGAKKYKPMKTAIFTSFIAIASVSVILTVLGLFASPIIMHLLNTPNDIFDGANLYLKIYIAGLVFLFMYNICTGIFTSLGDSKTPLYFLIASSLANIALDLLFVKTFHMGVAGVAWATFICQGVASILACISIIKRVHSIPTSGHVPYFSWNILKQISVMAIPSILQQSFISVGNLFIQVLVNDFGSSTVAAYSAAVKLNTFALTSFTTLGSGISNFTAQNIGAAQIERVKKGFHEGLWMIMIICIPFVFIFFVFSEPMIKLFLSDTGDITEVVKTGTTFLKIISPFYFAISVKLIADGVLRGASAMKHFMIATFTDLILRVTISFILTKCVGLGSIGIWLSWPIGWVIAMILSVMFYLSGVWKTTALVQTDLA